MISGFRKTFFPDASAADWADWKWQMRNRLRRPEDFARIFDLTADEASAIRHADDRLPVALTPYYASLMSRTDAEEPLRRAHLPREAEFVISEGEHIDPLGEEKHAAAPGITHRYPDRVRFLITNQCPVYCRFCMRSRLVGKMDKEHLIPMSQWEASLKYIRENKEIREVLLTGGEPLMLGDERSQWLLAALDQIPHVEIIRFSTKMVTALPQRITPSFIRALKTRKPIWMALHILHASEITTEFTKACERLVRAGIVLTTQTPLLKGVNDDAEVMRELMTACVRNRIRPYYIFQCDPIVGSAYLRPSLEKGLEIIEALQGSLSGHAVPHYVVDMEGAGKMTLAPQRYVSSADGYHHFVNFRGEEARYFDPGTASLYDAKEA